MNFELELKRSFLMVDYTEIVCTNKILSLQQITSDDDFQVDAKPSHRSSVSFYTSSHSVVIETRLQPSREK
jgi:hypothetical protein